MTLAMIVWGAAPAAAGGPTSAFLASPTTGETAGLYYSDRDYAELESLLRAGTLGAPPKDVMADRRVTVTWLVHDTSPWRVDVIFPVAGGKDVWVQRAMNITEPTENSWHRAPAPAELRSLLTDLGVLGKPEGVEELSAFSLREVYEADRESGVAAEPAPGSESGSAEKAAAPRSVAAAQPEDGTDWWWALPGAAGGAALALFLRPFAARVPWGGRGRDAGPRQELLDA
ncbi:hypothetical protein STRCI_005000 [Streptomyces cinnabarinus]|uniref:DUF2330 domain-containing protein n=1 Tax=Streptomyces cinnabarinus TaxID=67287 RepID=A0ABY7KJ94_9ACTN|nr:hypothetical protein [Streptomyces cinnabarinus]WAZ23645.1 hypothetical protein STRCI_005000 [Streptomyces cinnabarinus]